jgi:Winged helix DNA-binding domain
VGNAERTLTQRELNRALLARQLLLERARLPIPRALERIAGIQDQYAPNAYIRLWSCLGGFERDHLTRALEKRTVVQATLMRGTIHAVSARDYEPFRAAIARSRREWSSRIHKGRGDGDRRALVARVRNGMRGRTCPRQELREMRGRAGDAAWQTIDTDAALLRAPPSGTWERRRADLYVLADDWIAPADVAEDIALEQLVARYLRAFGPASRMDISTFTGLGTETVRRVLDHLSLRCFRDEAGDELLDVPRAPLPAPDTPAQVRFLPTWDAVLLVHARRTGIVPEKYRPLVFHTKNPPSVPTVLVDGVVAGSWKYANGRVRWEAFERLDRGVVRELDEEAERLAALHE